MRFGGATTGVAAGAPARLDPAFYFGGAFFFGFGAAFGACAASRTRKCRSVRRSVP